MGERSHSRFSGRMLPRRTLSSRNVICQIRSNLRQACSEVGSAKLQTCPFPYFSKVASYRGALTNEAHLSHTSHLSRTECPGTWANNTGAVRLRFPGGFLDGSCHAGARGTMRIRRSPSSTAVSDTPADLHAPISQKMRKRASMLGVALPHAL